MLTATGALLCKQQMWQQERGYTLVLDRPRLEHRIQPGDTLFSVADQYVVSFDDLITENRQLDLIALPVGSVLKIPLNQRPRSTYTVRQGDDLWKIAQLTGVSMSTILADNPHAMPLTPGASVTLRTYPPSYQIDFQDDCMFSTPSLPERWQQDEHFNKVLKAQHEFLKPHGKAVFKYPSVEASQLECFVKVQ